MVAANRGWQAASGEAFEAELMSCREALSWLRREGFMTVDVESDCRRLLHALKGDEVSMLEYLFKTVGICYMISQFSSFEDQVIWLVVYS